MNKHNQKSVGIILGIMTILTLLTGSILIWRKLNPTPTIQVLYNQVGYLPADNKVFFVEIPLPNSDFVGEFSISDSKGNAVIEKKALIYLGSLWNRYYAQGNFSEITASGQYQLAVSVNGNRKTNISITIGGDVYNLVLERAVNFYFYQRCGQKVPELIPGYVGHELCHADDGIWWNESGTKVWRDLSGGWHDAGDYGKYTEDTINTQFAIWALTYVYETNIEYWGKTAHNLYDTNAPDVIDEAVWGAKFMQKMVVRDANDEARVFCGVFGIKHGNFSRFSYWGEPSGETDNIPRTGDERTVGSLYNVSNIDYYKGHQYGWLFVNLPMAMMTAAALANTANIQSKYASNWQGKAEAPSNLMANATAIFESHKRDVFYSNGTIRENMTREELWPTLLALTALAKWAQQNNDNAGYTGYINEGMMIREAILNGTGNQIMPMKTDAQWLTPQYCFLATYLFEQLANSTVSPLFISTIGGWANKTWERSCNASGNYFHYAKNLNSYFNYWGANMVISMASMSGILAWNVTGGQTENKWMQDYAYDNVVHWIMGRNPLDICQIESLGIYNLPIYHNRLVNVPGNPRGAVPGAVPNGIGKPSVHGTFILKYENEYEAYEEVPDIPWFDMREAIPERRDLGDFRTNEVYIQDNSHFLVGFAAVRNLSNTFFY